MRELWKIKTSEELVQMLVPDAVMCGYHHGKVQVRSMQRGDLSSVMYKGTREKRRRDAWDAALFNLRAMEGLQMHMTEEQKQAMVEAEARAQFAAREKLLTTHPKAFKGLLTGCIWSGDPDYLLLGADWLHALHNIGEEL